MIIRRTFFFRVVFFQRKRALPTPMGRGVWKAKQEPHPLHSIIPKWRPECSPNFVDTFRHQFHTFWPRENMVAIIGQPKIMKLWHHLLPFQTQNIIWFNKNATVSKIKPNICIQILPINGPTKLISWIFTIIFFTIDHQKCLYKISDGNFQKK